MWRHPATRDHRVPPRFALRRVTTDVLNPTQADSDMMRRALELAAEASNAGEVPVGAVVFETESGKIIGTGRNTRHHDRDPAGHAEFIAIREACSALGDWRLNYCTLVVTLEPCIMCAGLILNARVGRLVYGADDPKAGAVHSLYNLLEDPRLNHRIRAIGGVERAQCSDILRQFFFTKRKPESRSETS